MHEPDDGYPFSVDKIQARLDAGAYGPEVERAISYLLDQLAITSALVDGRSFE